MKKIIILLITFFIGLISVSAFDLTNITQVTGKSVGFDGTFYDVQISHDGNYILYLNDSDNLLYSVPLNIAYDISSYDFNLKTTMSSGDSRPRGLSISPDGLNIYTIGRTNLNINHYTLTTPYDLTTATYISSLSVGVAGSSNYADIFMAPDGLKLFVIHGYNVTTNNDNYFKTYTLTTPYDLTTAILDNTINATGFNSGYFHTISISNDGLKLFLDASTSALLQYDLINPYEINLSNLNSYYNFSGYNDFSHSISLDGTKMYGIGLTTDFIYEFNTNSNIIINTDLEVIDDGNIQNIEGGIRVNDFNVNNDYELSYNITKYDGVSGNIVGQGDLGSFSGGLNNIDIFFNFEDLGNYDIGLFLTNSNDPTDTIIKYYNIDYLFNGGYIDPDVNSFSYTVSGYSFYENGFSLDNFLPDPFGGEVYFDIIAPSPTGTGTIDLTTQKYDNRYYGFDSSLRVDYPYHQMPGIYQVRTVYEYSNVTDYPFGTGFADYNITLPESPANYSIYDDIDNIELDFFQSLSESLGKIKDFFSELMNIGNVETKEWGFNLIPITHAEMISDKILPEIREDQDNIFSDMYAFLKGFVIFAFTVLLLIILLLILKKD